MIRKPEHQQTPSTWEQIQNKLFTHRPQLARNGCVRPKVHFSTGTTAHVVRWREPRPGGGLVQRSLYIGCDPAVVTKTRELIADWQARHRELLRTADLAAVAHGASTRRRRALKKQMNQLAGNPLGLWPLLTDPASRAHYMGRGQGGRPRRSGLW